MNLTKVKADLLRSLLDDYVSEQNYYPIKALPDISNEASAAVNDILSGNFPLLLFRFDDSDVHDIKYSHRIQIVFTHKQESQAEPKLLHVTKYVKYVTKKIVERDLATHEDPLVQRMRGLLMKLDWKIHRQLTAVMCHAIVTAVPLDLIQEISTLPLYKKITLDSQLGEYNKNELDSMGIDEVTLVNSFCTFQHPDLDFESMINKDSGSFAFHDVPSSNFSVNITSWDGTKLITSSSDQEPETSVCKACEALLYKKCVGTRVARWGYSSYKYDNYFVIVKALSDKSERWMAIYYCVDNASCAGFVFVLSSFMENSLAALWRRISSEARMKVIRANLDPTNPQDRFSRKYFTDTNLLSDSEPDDDDFSDNSGC